MARFQMVYMLTLSILPGVVTAQSGGKWTIYANANGITGIAHIQEQVWCATGGGVVCWNTRTRTYRQFTTLDGLQSNGISSITAGRGGEVWAGSYWGLYRFDVNSWRMIPHEAPVPHSGIHVLAVAPDGAVWIGMNSGISQYDGVSWKDYTVNDGLPTGVVGSIDFDRDGNPWCTVYGAVYRFDGSRWQAETAYSRDGEKISLDILIADREDVFWGIQGKKMYRHIEDTWVPDMVIDAPYNSYIQTLDPSPDGGIWGGMDRGFIFQLKDGQCKIHTLPDTFASAVILSLKADAVNAVWVGTTRGLLCFDGVSWQQLPTDDALPYPYVSSGTIAPDGSVWFGTGEGISRYNRNTWQRFLSPDSLYTGASALVIAPNGGLWLGNDRGLWKFDGVSWTDFSVEAGCDHMGEEPYLPSLAVGLEGTFWANRYRGGLSRFDGKSWKYFTEADGLPSQYVRPLVVEPDNTLWAVAARKIYSFDGKTWRIWTADDGLADLSDSSLLKILVGPDGAVWCSIPGGVSRFDGVRWNTYVQNDSLKTEPITSFAIGSDGSMWLGSGKGAYRFDGSRWTHYTPADGLADIRVNSITIDLSGAVWFGTSQGISRFVPDTVATIKEEKQLFSITLSNRPNPFNPSTTISFTIPERGPANLSIYSITGQKVRTLVSGPMSAGEHSVVWDGRDDGGKAVSSGVYVCRLEVDKRAESKRMLLIK